ncbi:hypothetical protein BpHYR1_037936 [Brachionus plicatilis]|uniref:Uncharacterized protein n=1 Tax=Brachionus plicatilis TaxID=10195 RepID=A0A3M7QDB2_BRAPC|nr:hypothetical protein BpHYR1_037936 [Brachionus plicatilis]
MKPLIQKPKNPSLHSEDQETRLDKPNVLSRHDSFDQKLDVKSGGKRRKKNRNMVAGSVGSGIGSPRNMAENLEDIKNKSYSVNLNGDVLIPITYDQRTNADSRVAYRLASNQDNLN